MKTEERENKKSARGVAAFCERLKRNGRGNVCAAAERFKQLWRARARERARGRGPHPRVLPKGRDGERERERVKAQLLALLQREISGLSGAQWERGCIPMGFGMKCRPDHPPLPVMESCSFSNTRAEKIGTLKFLTHTR